MEGLNPETLGTAVFMLTSMVIGATELVKRAFAADWRTTAIIAVAALVGGLGGLVLLPEVGLVGGIVIGLSASGVVTGIQKFGHAVHSDAVVLHTAEPKAGGTVSDSRAEG